MGLARLLARARALPLRRHVRTMGPGGVWLPSHVHGPGRFLTIGRHCLIQGRFECQRAGGQILIGDETYIAPGALIDCAAQVTIGPRCLIANDAVIADHDAHAVDPFARSQDALRILAGASIPWQDIGLAPVELGELVWIARRAIILKGVRIGARSIVGAGAVVTRSVPAEVVVAGNPARIVRAVPRHADARARAAVAAAGAHVESAPSDGG